MKTFIQLPSHKFQCPTFQEKFLHGSGIVVLYYLREQSHFCMPCFAVPTELIACFTYNLFKGRREIFYVVFEIFI